MTKIHFLTLLLVCTTLVNACSSDSPTVSTQEKPNTYRYNGNSPDGVGSGGGGDVLVCYDENDQIKDMESYDLVVASSHYRFEFSRAPLGQNVLVIDKNNGYERAVENTLQRFSRLDPIFAKHIREYAKELSPAQIANGTNIRQVPAIALNGDNGGMNVPVVGEGCARVTHERVFWQVDEPRPYQYAYQMVPRLWDKAPVEVRTALVLHEALWRFERTEFEPVNSLNSQYLNAFLNSKQLGLTIALDYHTMIRKIRDEAKKESWAFLAADKFSVKYGGALYSVSEDFIPASFSKDGLTRGTLVGEQSLKRGDANVTVDGPVIVDADSQLISARCKLPWGEGYVSQDKAISAFRISSGGPGTCNQYGRTRTCDRGVLSQEGDFKQCFEKKPVSWPLVCSDKSSASQTLYLSIAGRCADPSGLEYWNQFISEQGLEAARVTFAAEYDRWCEGQTYQKDYHVCNSLVLCGLGWKYQANTMDCKREFTHASF